MFRLTAAESRCNNHQRKDQHEAETADMIGWHLYLFANQSDLILIRTDLEPKDK